MPVSLVDGSRLIDLLIDNKVGVNEETVIVRSLDTDYFSNDEQEDDQITKNGKKFKVMWPLPGGVDSYVLTLNKLLEEISNGESSQKKLVKWFISEYKDVTSESTSKGYLRVPRYIGLININDGKVALTDSGREYVRGKSQNFLFNLIGENILAFSDVYEYVKSSLTPVTENEILEFLRDNFDEIDWNTLNQVNFRLRWMMNLDKVKKSSEGYTSINSNA